MGKLTPEVFNESCCDGGETNRESCQPCGCDPKAGWTCAMHQARQTILNEMKGVLTDITLVEGVAEPAAQARAVATTEEAFEARLLNIERKIKDLEYWTYDHED